VCIAWLWQRLRWLGRLYRVRAWVIMATTAVLFLVVFLWARTVTHVTDPPINAPKVDIVVPVTSSSYVDSLAEFGVTLGVRGCRNPVTVVAQLGVPGAGQKRNWLRGRSLIAFGVTDASAHAFRLFVGDPSAVVNQLGRPEFRGSKALIEIASGDGRDLEVDPRSRGREPTPAPNLRGIEGHAPPISIVARQNPEVVVVFDANWVASRSYGTCYLQLPEVPQPGPNPLLPLPAPSNVTDTLGYQAADVTVDDIRFDGRGLGSMKLIRDDSSPVPVADQVQPHFQCTGAERACAAGT
jgi:hypothetical protein